jgi:hypothetical protein
MCVMFAVATCHARDMTLLLNGAEGICLLNLPEAFQHLCPLLSLYIMQRVGYVC